MADEERRLMPQDSVRLGGTGFLRGRTRKKDAHPHACCVRPGLNTAVRVEFMARHVTSRAGNVTHDLFVTLLYRCVVCATYQ